MVRLIFCLSIFVQMCAVALAQNHHAPYADLKDRAIKALSDQQIADLKAGRGTGLALPAELNGYPGPMHVLEHADAMRLSPDQRRRTAELFETMKREAIPLGERLVESEAGLERLFASRQITPANLGSATEDIARTQGQLRQTHLKYHLAMVDLLTPEQIAHYRQLRGYDRPAGAHPHRHKHHH